MGSSDWVRAVRAGARVCAALAVSVPQLVVAQDTALDEITVTAQKREQSALDVPITVDVFTATDIEQTGALTLRDIRDFIPGFEIGSNPTQASIRVRGISSANISTGGDPSVATFYDDIYVPRAATTASFTDVARVEVLKGPQGTLYGRNAAVGVVSIVPNRPGAEDEAFVKSRLGNYDLMRLEAMGNVALSDSFFLRANVLSNRRDGYIKNLVPSERDGGEQENLAARISALWRVSAQTDLQFSYDYDEVDNAPRPAIGLSAFSACPSDPRCGLMLNDVIDGKETRDMWTANAKLNHEINEQWSLKLVTGYRQFETFNKQDEDGTAEIDRYLTTNNVEDSDISYSELQFNFSNDRVNIVFGANYSKEGVYQEIPIETNVDTVMRAVTSVIRGGVVDTVNGQLAQMGLPPVSEQEALAILGQQLGLPFTPDLDHIWDPVTMSIFLGTQGLNVTPQDVVAAGDFYYDTVQATGFPGPFVGPSFAGQVWRELYINDGDFTNWGIYGDVDFEVNERLNLLFGLRYSYDDKTFSWRNPASAFSAVRPGTPDFIFQPVPGYLEARTGTLTATNDWDKLTGRAVVQYQVTDRAQAFASYSTGYKSGGYDSLDVSTSDNPLRPEESENFEIGLKGDFANDRLRAQISLYDMTIDNRQRTVDSRPPGQTNPIPTINLGDQDVQGVEVVVNWMATDALRFGLVTEWREAQATWDEFFNAAGDVDGGSDPKFATNTSYTITIGWQPEITWGAIDMRVDYIFYEDTSILDDPNFVDAADYPGFFEDRKELNARIAWLSDDDRWTAALWGKNLLDQQLLTSVGRISRPLGTPFTSIREPLTWGVEIGYRFQ
ncbi:MAG: TonB-dependent receptor [Woeseiaceae bacterium]|nr:TonB-dependent receptor [Woeseiaceae bacterium]